MYGAETWRLRKVDDKYLESFEMWCWRRMAKIGWTDHVRTEERLQRVKVERNILHTIDRRKANWIGHILRSNCRVIERYKEQEDEEEDVRSYWMTLKKETILEIERWKH